VEGRGWWRLTAGKRLSSKVLPKIKKNNNFQGRSEGFESKSKDGGKESSMITQICPG
jgi:hypothetical protein